MSKKSHFGNDSVQTRLHLNLKTQTEHLNAIKTWLEVHLLALQINNINATAKKNLPSISISNDLMPGGITFQMMETEDKKDQETLKKDIEKVNKDLEKLKQDKAKAAQS